MRGLNGTHLIMVAVACAIALAMMVATLRAAPAIVEGAARTTDGDTVIVDGYTVRLKGVDAPEQWMLGGPEATAAMREIVGSWLKCELTGEKTRGREVGFCRNAAGEDIGQAIIEGVSRSLAHTTRSGMSSSNSPKPGSASAGRDTAKRSDMTKTTIIVVLAAAVTATAARAQSHQTPIYGPDGKYLGSVFDYGRTQTYTDRNGHLTGSSINQGNGTTSFYGPRGDFRGRPGRRSTGRSTSTGADDDRRRAARRDVARAGDVPRPRPAPRREPGMADAPVAAPAAVREAPQGAAQRQPAAPERHR
jgi:hypothetical protein